MMGKAAWVPEEFPGDVRVLTGSGSDRSQDASPKVTLSRRLSPFRAMPTQRASGAHFRDLTRAQRAPVHAPNTVVFAGTIAKQRCDMRSEEHTSELQSLMRISYAVFCLKKKKKNNMF